jgi:hypothetical protein
MKKSSALGELHLDKVHLDAFRYSAEDCQEV